MSSKIKPKEIPERLLRSIRNKLAELDMDLSTEVESDKINDSIIDQKKNNANILRAS